MVYFLVSAVKKASRPLTRKSKTPPTIHHILTLRAGGQRTLLIGRPKLPHSQTCRRDCGQQTRSSTWLNLWKNLMCCREAGSGSLSTSRLNSCPNSRNCRIYFVSSVVRVQNLYVDLCLYTFIIDQASPERENATRLGV